MAGVLEDVRAEDFVEYFIFPNHNSVSSALDEINKKVSSYVKDYIWHKDPFFLNKVEGSENNGKLFKFCFALLIQAFFRARHSTFAWHHSFWRQHRG
jgi:hypothetical protein